MPIFTSLYRRLLLLLVLPLVLFLAISNIVEYLYLRTIVLTEWRQATLLRLEKAARQVDEKVGRIVRVMEAFAQTGGNPLGAKKHEWLLNILEKQEGVSRVRLSWQEGLVPTAAGLGPTRPDGFIPPRIHQVSAPTFALQPDGRTVSLQVRLQDKKNKLLGHLEVALDLATLMPGQEKGGWHLSNLLCLVDKDGRYVVHPDPAQQGQFCWGPPHDELEAILKEAVREEKMGTILKRSYLADRVVGYVRLKEAPWALLLHASSTEILGSYLRFRFSYIFSSLLTILVILALLRWGLGAPLASLRQLSEAANEVAQGRYGTPLPVRSQDEIGRLTQSFNAMVQGLQERDFIQTTFGRYVDAKVAREILRSPLSVRMGGQKRQVAILMTDIRGFTPLAETLTPDMTITLLNQHFARIIAVVQNYDGIIVDFFGDSVLAFFDPLEEPLPPVVRRALKCALQIQSEMAALRTDHPEWPFLALGIGLHAGEVVVGNIGSETRTKYGIVGSAVNLTHRLQALAQDGEVVISEAVYQHTHGAVAVQREIKTELKGFTGELTLYVVTELGVPMARAASGTMG